MENTGPPATYNLLWCVSADCQNTQTLWRYLTVTDTTLTGLRPATAYAVGVQAVNAEGNGPWNDSNTATTAAAPNRAPVLAGPADTTVEENTPVVGPYTATDADGDTLRWSRAGADADAFALMGTDSTRTLQFKVAPNYEQPADTNGDSLYAVALIVTDDGTPPLADTLTVSVRVQDADDPGTLTLSSLTPQVGDLLRATLTDEDAPLVFEPSSLQWSYFYEAAGAGEEGHGLEEVSRILSVSTVHLGLRLLAKMHYEDRHGPQRAISDTTAAVVGPPWKPQGLTATAGDGQVSLGWQPPVRLGGSDLVRYEYWHSGQAAGVWSSVAGGASARSVVVDSLINGTGYTLAVRAVNGYGAGTADSTQATPQAADRPPEFTAGPTDPTVDENTTQVGEYAASDPDGDTIRWSLEGTNPTAFELVGTDTTRTLQFKTAPNFEAKKSYSVTVRVSSSPDSGGEGEGGGGRNGVLSATRAVTVTVEDVAEPPPAPTLTVAVPSTNGHTALDVSWTAPDTTGIPAISDYTLETCSGHCKDFTSANWTAQTRTDTSTTLTDLTPSTQYFARVRARNAEGDGAWSAVRSAYTQAAPDSPPKFTEGPTDPSVDENTTRVGEYAASDPDGDTITWSLEGTNAPAFELVGTDTTRTLQFKAAPNFETKASYSVTVKVSSAPGEGEGGGGPPLTATRAVTVTVNNVDEVGTLDLSTTTPEVGKPITATLGDEDGILSIQWWWHAVRRSGTEGASDDSIQVVATNGPSTSETDTYTPLAYLAGFSLRAKVTYTDLHREKTQYSDWTEPVYQPPVEDPGAVSLSPSSPRVREPITATLTDADGSISGACWTWQRRASSTAAWVSLTSPCSSSATSYTPQDADAGYQLRATVSYQDGHGTNQDMAESSATAAVQANVPTAPQNLAAAAPSPTEVNLTWDAPRSTGGATISGYKYRYKAEGG